MPNAILQYITIQNIWLILLAIVGLGICLYFTFLYFRNRKIHQEDSYLLFQKHKEISEKEEEIRMQADNLIRQKEEVDSQSQKLKAAYRKLKELDRFKEALTDMIVHDLKNPLNTIINLSDKNSNIELAGKKMLNMVLSILDIRKFEEAEIQLDKEIIGVDVVTEQAIQEVEYLLIEKDIKLALNIKKGLFIKADSDILLRVIVNLLTNAIKHTPNSGTITLKSEYCSEKECVSYKVIDTGEGIPEKDIRKIFTKFGQVKARKSGKVRATGLGLTFCKMAIEAHQGSIGVETELEKGSTFWFNLEGFEEKKQKLNGNGIVHKDFNGTLILEEGEKVFFKEYYSQIKQLDVYEYSEMRKILQDMSQKNGSENIEKWQNEMENAINTCNETKYESLVAQLI